VWIVTTWQFLTRSVVKGFKKCCISSAVDGTDDDMLWNGSDEDGCECMKMKALTVKMETMTLTGRGG
jgi:hypothetical protein